MRRLLTDIQAVVLSFAALHAGVEYLLERVDLQTHAHAPPVAILEERFGPLRLADEPASPLAPDAPVFSFTMPLSGTAVDLAPTGVGATVRPYRARRRPI
jgi:hypothetical protein